MATIYAFKNFNNYYNRKLKGQTCTTINDFLSLYGDYEYIQTGTTDNFDENDGVVTSHVLGRQSNPYEGKCDYLLVCKDNVNIDSKWFIIDQDKQCFGQYKLSLYRDVISDYWNVIKDSPMFIEKAILTDNDPLIFNSEDMSVNQIKTSETLLKDATGCPWIVIYYDKTKTINGSITPKHNYDISVEDKDVWVSDNTFRYLPQDANDVSFRALFNTPFSGNIRCAIDLNTGTQQDHYNNTSSLINNTGLATVNTAAFDKSIMFSNLLTDFTAYKDNTYFEAFYNAYNGGVLYQNSGTVGYYRINITLNQTYATEHKAVISGDDNYSYLSGKILTNSSLSGTVNDKSFEAQIKYYTFTISLTPLYNNETITYEVDSGCYDLSDAPYRMACMPYGNITEKFTGETDVTSNKEINFAIANNLPANEGSDIYDIQIVPYCPLNDEFIIEGGINAGSDSLLAHPMISNNTTIGYIYSCSQSSFKRHIDFNKTITNPKIENQCDLYRICSPNYQGVFEFNAAKNLGITGFDISCTYKPHIPYIHVNPDFQGLYGTDFGDNRGLICGGDFSLARTSDAYTEFQLQNKNFQASFDREIQNMEVQHKYGMIEAGIGTALGAIGAGATAGMITANPVVGVLAAGASAMGGKGDMFIKQELHNEALDYKKDMFGYNLDNIKAQPRSLSRTTAYNSDNKYFPFLEYYTCTDTEKTAFANKIAYNSMKVGVIGTISEYLLNSWSYGDITDKGYIKGQLIRIEGVNDDTHVVNAIAEELNKGVFTK